MSLRIFHTADVHLGLKFSRFSADISSRLIEARFETLQRMVDLANEKGSHLFVVAGDLFDTIKVGKKVLQRAAKILGNFEGVVLVLPGNHDYATGSTDDIWSTFQEEARDGILVLQDERPVSLKHMGIDACIYPGPCRKKHSDSHALTWLETETIDTTHTYHIGIAHGTYEGLSPDIEGRYFQMKRADIARFGLDLWMMGHIHKQFPENPGPADRVFYPANPEPDGFDCKHGGRAWLLELHEDKSIRAESLQTGRFRFWRPVEDQITSLADLRDICTRLMNPTYKNRLVELSLAGYLNKEEYAELHGILEPLHEHFVYFAVDASDVRRRLSPDDINREFTENSFSNQLLQALALDDADAEALEIAYDLLQEAKDGDASL